MLVFESEILFLTDYSFELEHSQKYVMHLTVVVILVSPQSTGISCSFMKLNMYDYQSISPEEVTDGRVVRVGISVTWNVLS